MLSSRGTDGGRSVPEVTGQLAGAGGLDPGGVVHGTFGADHDAAVQVRLQRELLSEHSRHQGAMFFSFSAYVRATS